MELGTEVHVPLLAAIEVAAAGIFPPGSLPDHLRADSTPVENLFEAVQQGLLWVALARNGSPVGYAYVQMVENMALLAEIDVHPTHMCKGIGSALVAEVAANMRVRQMSALYLTTFDHVPWNAPFYAKQGFVALDSTAVPPFLRNILEEEKRAGLPNRIGMCLSLNEGQGGFTSSDNIAVKTGLNH